MRFPKSGLALLSALTVAGCDIPTDPPMVEQRWIVPLDNASISVDELLPDGVIVAGESFAVTVDPFQTEGVLGGLCAACVEGSAGPAPAFTGTFSGTQTYPAGVTSAVVATGSIAVAVHNGFAFDPVAGGGKVVITITDGPSGRTLGEATISTGMAPGSTTTRGITLVESPSDPRITAVTQVTSVGGQNATIDTSQKLTVNVEPVSIMASSAGVLVSNKAVDIDPTELDVSDIDSSISDHIESGSIVLNVTNPFGVAVATNLVITYPGGSISRSVSIAGTAISTTSVTYSGDEFRSFLGKEGVTMTGEGIATRASGPVIARPGAKLVMDATLDLTLIIG